MSLLCENHSRKRKNSSLKIPTVDFQTVQYYIPVKSEKMLKIEDNQRRKSAYFVYK